MSVNHEFSWSWVGFGLICFGVILILAGPARAANDGGAIEELLETARSKGRGKEIKGGPIPTTPAYADSDHGCPVDFTSDILSLANDEKYVRAEFVMGEDCRLIPSEVVRSSAIPAGVLKRILARAASPDQDATGESSLKMAGTVSGSMNSSSYNCQVEVWEEDVVSVHMITATDSVNWDTEGGKILEARAHWNAFPNLDWWFKDGKLDGGIRFVAEPYTATTWVTQKFYCNEAGPISRYVCNGPSYRIALHGSLLIDGGGKCSGQAKYSGTIVPAGRVLFEVTRQ